MSTSRIRTSLAIALLAAPALFTIQPALADEQYVFASVKHVPDWQVDAGVQAATRACDPNGRKGYETAAFRKCMLRLGWRYTHVRRFASPSRSVHERELDKKNQDEALWAQQQREEQARNDETTANAIAAAQASANQPNP